MDFPCSFWLKNGQPQKNLRWSIKLWCLMLFAWFCFGKTHACAIFVRLCGWCPIFLSLYPSGAAQEPTWLLVKLKPCQMIFLEDENTLGWGDFWSSTCNKHPTLLIISSKQYTYIILYKLYIYNLHGYGSTYVKFTSKNGWISTVFPSSGKP